MEIIIGGSWESPKREQKGKSRLIFPTDYVVLDVETTGLDPSFDEIIEIAGIKIENGAETARFQSLVKPVEEISGFITKLTGISNEMVTDAPPIEVVLPVFLDFVGGFIVVGHNANFDINFLYDKTVNLGLPPFGNDFVDTRRISRRLFPDLKNHKLSTLIAHLGVGESVEHRALSDCIQTRQCLERMRDYAENHGGIPKADWELKKRNRIKSKDIRPTITDFNMDGPIYGMTFVFTGALERMTRQEAMQTVVDAGGFCKDNVSSKVNYLVLGNLDYCKTVKDGKSTKMKKAEALKLSGADIETISENVFYDMLGDSFAFRDENQIVDPPQGTYRDGILLSPEENAAVSAIFSCLGDFASLVHLDVRSDNYLTLLIPDDGSDFCRVKSSPRTLWMSLDAWVPDFPRDDKRLENVPNKNQRHWKISMSSVDEIANYRDLIHLVAKGALESEGRYYEKAELEYLESVRPLLQTAVEAKGGLPDMLSFRPTKADASAGVGGYTAVSLSGFTVCRVRMRGRKPYISVPAIFEDLIPADFPTTRIPSDKKYIRLMLDYNHPAEGYTDFLARIAGETVSRYPKEWDCCSRYMECSDAKACVHPDKAFALGCGYRRILASGRIFYGANRNID